MVVIARKVFEHSERLWGLGGRQSDLPSFAFSPLIDSMDPQKGKVLIEVFNSDVTGTRDYSIVRITGPSEEVCENEFDAQETDGVWENSRLGSEWGASVRIPVEECDGFPELPIRE